VGAFNGEIHVDWISFGVELPVSILETKAVREAKIYPNPTSQEFFLDMDLVTGGHTVVEITDLSGKLIQSLDLGYMNTGHHQTIVSVQNLNAGMYLVNTKINTQNVLVNKLLIR